VDFREVANPTSIQGTAGALDIRHLARPTTVVDYSWGVSALTGRPLYRAFDVRVREFFPLLKGAGHVGVHRAVNRGAIQPDSPSGELSAWRADLSWWQNLWDGGLFKASYRYYQEDEKTRAFGDLVTFGSDTVTAGLAQRFDKGLELACSASRYLTNTDLHGSGFEVTVSRSL
jgi:hypothetical protein